MRLAKCGDVKIPAIVGTWRGVSRRTLGMNGSTIAAGAPQREEEEVLTRVEESSAYCERVSVRKKKSQAAMVGTESVPEVMTWSSIP